MAKITIIVKTHEELAEILNEVGIHLEMMDLEVGFSKGRFIQGVAKHLSSTGKAFVRGIASCCDD